jgi:hypothetical protein
MSMRRGPRWLASVVLLATALTAIWRAGSGLLQPPPLSISGTQMWLAQRDALVVSFALLRVVALVTGAYLLLVLLVAGVAHVVAGAHRCHVILDRLSFGLARALLSTMGFTTVALAAGPPAHAQVPTSSTATIHAIGSTPSQSPTRATIHALPAGTTTTTTEPSPPAPAPAAPSPQPMQATPPTTTTRDAEQYVVAPGDSLWSVAASRVSEVTGRADPGDEAIASYWRTVLDANDLANPDLLFVGQTIELPAIAP